MQAFSGGGARCKILCVRSSFREEHGVRRKGGLGSTLVMALLIVVLSVALGVGISRFDFMARIPVVGPFLFEEQPARTTTSPVVVEGIRDLNQLATVRLTESVLITGESGGTGLERIFFGERVLLVAVGEVEAGVDLANMGEEDVHIDGDRVTIRLPEPEILSTSLDEDETDVYDRDFGPLNFRPNDELVEEARDEAVERVEEAARENDVLASARRNAEDSIRAFATTLGFEEVEFVS
jgi:hypothetical protein